MLTSSLIKERRRFQPFFLTRRTLDVSDVHVLALSRLVWWFLSSPWLLRLPSSWWLSSRCTTHEPHCASSWPGTSSLKLLPNAYTVHQSCYCTLTLIMYLCVCRVLVLYLGNLYSLIIALLDKVNSMSSAVSIETCICFYLILSITWASFL